MTSMAAPEPMRQRRCSEDLGTDVLAFISGSRSDLDFEELALRTFRWHWDAMPKYRAYCESRHVAVGRVRGHRDLPLLPVEAFKLLELTATPQQTVRRFSTSGTTERGHGVAAFDALGLDVMAAAIVANAQRNLFADGERWRILSLAPPVQAAPHLIMVHGLDVIGRRFGDGDLISLATTQGVDLAKLSREVERAQQDACPIVLVGASFSFVHLFDAQREASRRLKVPPGSRLLHAGGFKGRSREISAAELGECARALLGFDVARIVNLLGMTELASQVYDVPGADSGTKAAPGWMRSWVVAPEDPSREVELGEVGLLAHVDLANFSRPIGLLSDDLARRVERGFQILGRARGTDPRGCSLTADELWRKS